MSDVDQEIRDGHRRRVAATIPAIVMLAGVVTVGVSAVIDDEDRSDVETSEEPAQGQEGADSLAIVARPLEVVQQARVVGQLERRGDCLFVHAELASWNAVLWPAGTSWQPGPGSGDRGGAVVTPDDTTIPVGTWFEAAGGGLGVDNLRSELVTDDARQRLTACADGTSGDIVFPQGEFRAGGDTS